MKLLGDSLVAQVSHPEDGEVQGANNKHVCGVTIDKIVECMLRGRSILMEVHI